METVGRRSFIKSGTGLVMGLAGTTAVVPNTNAEARRTAGAGEDTTPLQLELRGNVLRFRAGWCEIPDWTLALEVDNELLSTKMASAKLVSQEPFQLEFKFSKHPLTWTIEAEPDDAANTVLLRSTIHNGSDKAVVLGKAFLLQTDSVGGFSRPGDALVYLPMTTGQGMKVVQKLNAGAATSEMAMEAFNQTQNKAFQAGFVTFQRAKSLVAHDSGPGKPLQLKAWCEFDGWELAPGTSTHTETLMVAVGENPHAQLEAWAEHAARLCHPRPREWEDSPNGWVGVSWVDPFYVEQDQATVLRNAKAVRERLPEFGIDYIWISIVNIKDNQPGYWLDWNYHNLPDGPQFFHAQLEELGFKWGLWCGAFMLSSRAPDKVKELKDALFKKPDGVEPMVYLPQWRYGPAGPSSEFKKPIYALDPSHPKTREFLRNVFFTYREWGVRYYMIDFLSAGADTLNAIPHAKHYDKKLVSGPEVYRTGLAMIREACGDDTHLLVATGPTIQAGGYMDSVRTGSDFGEGRPLNPLFDMYPGTFAINAPEHWTGPQNALANQAATYHMHRRLFICNSGNLLTVDKPLSLNQAQIHAAIHVMSGGPSMLGDDMTYIDEERLRLIKQTLPRPRNVAFPVDLFSKREQNYPRVYHRKITTEWGTFDVVAVYNLDADRVLEQDVDLKSLELDPSRHYHLWEFFNTEYVGKISGKLHAQVPPASVKIYRLTQDLGRPVIIGTDMHMLMGEMEVDRCDWNGAQQTLSGRATRPPQEKGSVYIYAPPKLVVANPKGYYLGHDARDNSLIIRCHLDFEEGSAEWNLKFVNL